MSVPVAARRSGPVCRTTESPHFGAGFFFVYGLQLLWMCDGATRAI